MKYQLHDSFIKQYSLGGLLARLEVAKLIFPYMVSIGAAYFITLCLYPGIVSEIISCKFESWMPVILMTAFNASDLLGKVSLIIINCFNLIALFRFLHLMWYTIIIKIQIDKIIRNKKYWGST